MGRLDKAEPLAREVAAEFERVHGPDDPGTLAALASLALLEAERGRHADAASGMRRVVEARTRILGERHLDTLAALANLGFVLWRGGDVNGAVAVWTPAWDGLRATVGEDHPTSVTVAAELIAACEAQGWPQHARTTVVELLAALRAAAERVDMRPHLLNNLAWQLVTIEPVELRDPAAAIGLASRACDADRAAGGSQLWLYLDTLALAQHASGAHEAAAATQREALRRAPPASGERPGMEERLREYELAAGAN